MFGTKTKQKKVINVGMVSLEYDCMTDYMMKHY